jgi:hypothetical protein
MSADPLGPLGYGLLYPLVETTPGGSKQYPYQAVEG